jgi:hypothetical protein
MSEKEAKKQSKFVTLTFSGEVPIILSIYVIMSVNTIIINSSLTCLWGVFMCYLIAGSAGVKRTVPFEIGGVATLVTLILMLSIVTTISSMMKIVWLTRRSRNGDREDYNSNSLWFLDLLLKVGLSDSPDMTFNFVSNPLLASSNNAIACSRSFLIVQELC